MARIAVQALAILTALAVLAPASAGEVEGCHFVWDVSHELAVMQQIPHSVTAAVKPGRDAPLLQVDQLYELKLSAQSGVSYAVKPAKPTLTDGVQGGLARFRLSKAGAYRISITSGHWIDVVDGSEVIKSRDFTGARGCARPRKIVEYDLPAGKDLTLQLSGSTDASVLLTITPVTGPATH